MKKKHFLILSPFILPDASAAPAQTESKQVQEASPMVGFQDLFHHLSQNPMPETFNIDTATQTITVNNIKNFASKIGPMGYFLNCITDLADKHLKDNWTSNTVLKIFSDGTTRIEAQNSEIFKQLFSVLGSWLNNATKGWLSQRSDWPIKQPVLALSKEGSEAIANDQGELKRFLVNYLCGTCGSFKTDQSLNSFSVDWNSIPLADIMAQKGLKIDFEANKVYPTSITGLSSILNPFLGAGTNHHEFKRTFNNNPTIPLSRHLNELEAYQYGTFDKLKIECEAHTVTISSQKDIDDLIAKLNDGSVILNSDLSGTAVVNYSYPYKNYKYQIETRTSKIPGWNINIVFDENISQEYKNQLMEAITKAQAKSN
jgi:hypothetical protein